MTRPSGVGAGESRCRVASIGLCAVLTALGCGLYVSMPARGASAQPRQIPRKEQPTRDAKTEAPASEKSFVIVEGQITDQIGAGQAGVTVTVRRASPDSGEEHVIGTATTNRFGDFAVESPEPVDGEVVVEFSKAHYATLKRTVRIDESGPPPFIADMLPGNLHVRGRVMDAVAGGALAGAAVTLRAAYADLYGKTDAHGRFSIDGVFPGRGELIVEAKGFGRERRVIEKLEDAEKLEVKLKPQRVVHFQIVNEAGKPIEGATVEGYDRPRDDFRTGVTDADGRVTFAGLHFDARHLTLRLTHPKYVSSEGFDRKIDPPAAQSESSHTLVMRQAGQVRGRISDATSGEPVHGARVITGDAYLDSSPRDWTDSDGRYTIRGVKPGEVVVTVHAGGHAPELETVEVAAGETARLDVTCQPGVPLVGMVKDETGTPIRDAFVETGRWRGYSTLDLRSATNKTGTFILFPAPRDEFDIVVRARGYQTISQVVKANEKEIVVITLPEASADEPAGDVPGVAVGDVAPDVTFTTLDGHRFNFAQLRGQTVLLQFWATWCAPCVAELPKLVEVFKKFGSRKRFVMIGVSHDFDERSLRDFLGDHGEVKWHQVLESSKTTRPVSDAFGVTWIPRVMLIGADGKIAATDLKPEEIVSAVGAALKDPAIP